MTEHGIFLDEQHPASGRFAVFEVEGPSAWLYLSAPGDSRPEKDIFAFSTGLLVTLEKAMEIAHTGNPPPLAAKHASEQAVIADARPEEFFFRWSGDGESVALLRQGEPLAMIVANSERGYSKALGFPGFYGQPWEQGHYDTIFGGERR